MNQYRITNEPHGKATNKRGDWDTYELENMNDVDYSTKEQKVKMDLIVKAGKDVEVEVFKDYAYRYAREFNEKNNSKRMDVKVLGSKPIDSILVKKTSFPTFSLYKNFTGLTIETVEISFREVNEVALEIFNEGIPIEFLDKPEEPKEEVKEENNQLTI
jgi:hypothetical protein